MATKADFTAAEWQVLQWAVSDTMTWLSMADPGFWDMFKEAEGAAKHVSGVRATSDNALVRELAADMRTRRDKQATANPGDMSVQVIERVKLAASLVAGKDPADLPAFKAYILGVAKATAEAAHGVGPGEAAAIAKLEEALG